MWWPPDRCADPCATHVPERRIASGWLPLSLTGPFTQPGRRRSPASRVGNNPHRAGNSAPHASTKSEPFQTGGTSLNMPWHDAWKMNGHDKEPLAARQPGVESAGAATSTARRTISHAATAPSARPTLASCSVTIGLNGRLVKEEERARPHHLPRWRTPRDRDDRGADDMNTSSKRPFSRDLALSVGLLKYLGRIERDAQGRSHDLNVSRPTKVTIRRRSRDADAGP